MVVVSSAAVLAVILCVLYCRGCFSVHLALSCFPLPPNAYPAVCSLLVLSGDEESLTYVRRRCILHMNNSCFFITAVAVSPNHAGFLMDDLHRYLAGALRESRESNGCLNKEHVKTPQSMDGSPMATGRRLPLA